MEKSQIMWLVEEKVQLPSDYDRKLIKNEINRILDGESVIPQFGPTIYFAKNGAIVNGEFNEIFCGPNRTYLDSNSFEICVCICTTGKAYIDSQLAIKIAKKLSSRKQSIREKSGENFVTTCSDINEILKEDGFKLVILYLEQFWVMSKKKKPNSKKNISTIVTYLEKKKKQNPNQNINEKGCCVLYGI